MKAFSLFLFLYVWCVCRVFLHGFFSCLISSYPKAANSLYWQCYFFSLSMCWQLCALTHTPSDVTVEVLQHECLCERKRKRMLQCSVAVNGWSKNISKVAFCGKREIELVFHRTTWWLYEFENKFFLPRRHPSE